MIFQDIISFIKSKYGTSNWIVAYRNTKRLKQRYGEDVVVIHPNTYQKLMCEYDAQFNLTPTLQNNI